MLMRLIKTLRLGRGSFHSLFLLMKSVQASFHALFWSVLLLLLMCLSFGMLINQMISSYFEDSDKDILVRKSVFLYFGTFTRTMLTMFEITLGNWAPPSRTLADNVSEFWAILITVYRNVFCFAVINVIRAVFIMETTRVASGDDEVAMMNKDRSAAVLNQKLKSIFSVLDSDSDGCLTRLEFLTAMSDVRVNRYMSTLELEGQADHLFTLVSSVKEGDSIPTVNVRDFTSRVGAFRGPAKAIDVAMLQNDITEIKEKLSNTRRHREAKQDQQNANVILQT